MAVTVAPDLAARVADVRERIRAAAPEPERVTLVAVTKGFGAEVVRDALAAGVADIGESYVQELVAKADELASEGGGPRWHAIGRLQRNKVRKAAPHVTLWHSVDRLALGQEIARFAPGAVVLVQVNVAGEAAKGGCEPAEAPALVDGLAACGLDVRGIMAMAPAGPLWAARGVFSAARDLRDRLGLSEASMGMTDDYEVALSEGATIVRVGRGLFGPRPLAGGARH